MSDALARLRRRLCRWLWGDPAHPLPPELRHAFHHVANEATALHALVVAMQREETREPSTRR